MANIQDYLDWRGDIPFSVDPFNEVDNLVLSELSYVDLDGIVPTNGEDLISLADACDAFFAAHTEEEILAQETFTRLSPFLMRKAAGSRRFGQTRLGRYVNVISDVEEEQMCALAFYLEDGTVYVAFRGTDATMVGWKEDFNLSFMSRTAGQLHGAAYLSENYALHEMPLRIGGHSKGGNFAVYAAAFCDQRVKDHIIEVWSNDGPGFLDEVIASAQYQEILPKVRSIIPAYSVFGLLLSSGYDHLVVESSNKGIYQHDALSWQVLGNHFVKAQGLTNESQFLEKTIDTWIAGYDMQERENFINLMFELFSTSGAQTITEFNAERVKNYTTMLKAYQAMNSEDQKVVNSTFKALFKSGVDTLIDGVKDSVKESVKEKEREGLGSKVSESVTGAISTITEKLPLSHSAKDEEKDS